MIRYTTGNLLDAPAEALVNTVNEVGVMGKGIALMFREGFPENTRVYTEACRHGEVRIGHMLVTRNSDLTGPRWIINFPTKKHWRQPSRLEWIKEGLKDLVRIVQEHHIRSIALPPLGCGNGGLQWDQVRREIEGALSSLADTEVMVFAPTDVYQNAPKRGGLKELTPARALVAEMVRRYSILGLECTNLEVQKLAWFLQRVIRAQGLDDPLKLQFVAHTYGPYADPLRHLLDNLDGSYLHCEKRLSDAGPFDLIWFEDRCRGTVETYLSNEVDRSYRDALETTSQIIDGFESPFGMELLSTVDWLLAQGRCETNVEAIMQVLPHWPAGKQAGKRKAGLFYRTAVAVALDRLQEFALPAT